MKNTKSDESVKNICIAAIKRTAKDPYNCELTSLFETNFFDEKNDQTFKLFDIHQNELPIVMVKVDDNRFTFVTTRQIVTRFEGNQNTAQPEQVTSWNWGDFKGYDKTVFTIGQLELGKEKWLDVFIETGRASMVMIYALMTLINLKR